MNNIIKKAISFTQELVTVPSESSEAVETGSPQEAGVVAVLERICREHDITYSLQEVLPGRSNFVASFPTPGASKLVFLAHMDTVSAKGMMAPFSGELRDNKIWGRGSCDDKGGLASLFATLIGLQEQGRALQYDVTLVGTVDEECLMSGSAKLAKENPEGWDLCVAMEPTLLQPISAHRGVYRCRILPHDGDDAGSVIKGIMNDLQSLEKAVTTASHPSLGKAVMTVTKIEGDERSKGRILVDIRLLPVHSPSRIHANIMQIVGKRGRVVPLFVAMGIDSDPQDKLIKSFQNRLAGQGLDDTLIAVPYATDCSQLRGRGACLVWGPGNPEQAHSENEFIEVEELERACRVLVDFLTGPNQ